MLSVVRARASPREISMAPSWMRNRASPSAPARKISAVSYTHLDVYKRQALDIGRHVGVFDEEEAQVDVYKRQP